MRDVTSETAADYLCETGRVPRGRAVAVRALEWGVSHVVMRVDVEGEPSFVLKQPLARLRTNRIWTERAAMELLTLMLPDGAVPRILFADAEDSSSP